MASVFDVSPYDGGWCVKIADTGEVLFFDSRRRAIAQAGRLACAWPRAVKVKVHARRSPEPEAWNQAPTDFAFPLGAPV
ncbi:hypothetical protein [Caulobacter segnis]